MSIYYTPAQRQHPLFLDEPDDRFLPHEQLDTAALSRSILIFPSPLSGLPSPSGGTPPSASCSTPSFTLLSPNEAFTYDSDFSDAAWSRAGTPPEPHSQWHLVSAPLHPWPPELAVRLPDRSLFREPAVSQSSAPESAFTMASTVPSEAAAAALAHADARPSLPLLSLLARLFGIDADTLTLVSAPQTPSDSVLFPGSAAPPPAADAAHGTDPQRPLLLLASADGSTRSVREGLRVASEADCASSSLRGLGAPLWDVVSDVVENGRRVWKAVWVRG